MSAWSAMGIVVIVAVMTYTMRAVAIVALAEREIPVNVERVLRNVGPAVLAALAINHMCQGLIRMRYNSIQDLTAILLAHSYPQVEVVLMVPYTFLLKKRNTIMAVAVLLQQQAQRRHLLFRLFFFLPRFYS